MPEHIYNSDDTKALGRGIAKSPMGTAQFFVDNYNAYAESPNLSDLEDFFRYALEVTQRKRESGQTLAERDLDTSHDEDLADAGSGTPTTDFLA
jgi:hypothetical protein